MRPRRRELVLSSKDVDDSALRLPHVTVPDNLRSLHQHEESIRADSLAAIVADEALLDSHADGLGAS